MSPEFAPLLIGFAASGMLLVVIGIVLAIRRLLERSRLRSEPRRSRGYEGWATSQEWVYRPRVPGQVREGSLAAVEEARRKADVMLADAERRSQRLLRESEAEAERRAGEIIEDAWKQAGELLVEAEFEVEKVTSKGAPARNGS